MDDTWAMENFSSCELGDKRLSDRALEIGQALAVCFGQALSMVFGDKNALQCAYDFFSNSKTRLGRLLLPASNFWHHKPAARHHRT